MNQFHQNLLCPQGVYGYIAVPLCVVGVASNILCILVFLHPRMRSAVNLILTALAAADILGLATKAVEESYMYIATNPWNSPPPCYPRGWTTYHLVSHCIFTYILTLNSWFTVAVAAIRYVAIAVNKFTVGGFSMRKSKITVGFITTSGLLVNVPYFLAVKVDSERTETENETHDCYFAAYDNILTWDSVQVFYDVFDFLPTVMLMLLCALLIRFIRQANRRRAKMTQTGQGRDAVTIMLLAVVMTSIITRFPFLVITQLSQNLGGHYSDVAHGLHRVMMLMLFLNSGVNIVFYSLTKQFKEGLVSLFSRQSQTTKSTAKSVKKTEISTVDNSPN